LKIFYKKTAACIPHLAFILTILSFLIVFFSFLWQGNLGFSLADEGYLWYGVQRVLAGEVPIRGFMAYDPGRYYWAAALTRVLGDTSILGLRAAVAVFQALGLAAALLLVAGEQRSSKVAGLLFLVLCAFVLVAWMFPRHKLFDISLSIFLVAALAWLVQRPAVGRYLLAGISLGLVAVFGRNHGVYGLVGSLGVLLWLNIRRTDGPSFVSGFISWTVGVVLGYAPLLLMALFVPGFATAFWRSVANIFVQKTTNLALPVPWPWTVPFGDVPLGDAIHGVLVGLFFIAPLVFGCLAVCWVLLQRFRGRPVPPALVAAAFLALPYAHYAFSRADVGHLAQGIFPTLIGCLVLLTSGPKLLKWSLGFVLIASSFWAVYAQHPGWQCRVGSQCVPVTVSHSTLLVPKNTARDIALIRELAGRYAPDGQSVFVTPFWPGAYALLERRAPVWATYALWPRSVAFQQQEIERIQAAQPGFALVFDFPLDGRDDLRFQNTHPLVYRYLVEHYDRLPGSANPAHQLFLPKRPGP
jgi:hypothetical protein